MSSILLSLGEIASILRRNKYPSKFPFNDNDWTIEGKRVAKSIIRL